MHHPRSPIFELENAIAGWTFRVAPERENQLAKLRDVNNLSLVLVNEPRFNIRVCLPVPFVGPAIGAAAGAALGLYKNATKKK